jgi:hypothetical protein
MATSVLTASTAPISLIEVVSSLAIAIRKRRFQVITGAGPMPLIHAPESGRSTPDRNTRRAVQYWPADRRAREGGGCRPATGHAREVVQRWIDGGHTRETTVAC